MKFETVTPKGYTRASDLFNLACGRDLYVVASICTRAGLTVPEPTDSVRCGFCNDEGVKTAQAEATHFGWTLTPARLHAMSVIVQELDR